MSEATQASVRCPRCGNLSATADKFCAECGRFLRDASIDQRLLLAAVHEREGRGREARQELQHLLDAEPDNVLGNHQLGNLLFHEGLLDQAIEHYRRAVTASSTFVLAYYDLGVAYYHRGTCRRRRSPSAAVSTLILTTTPLTTGLPWRCFTRDSLQRPVSTSSLDREST